VLLMSGRRRNSHSRSRRVLLREHHLLPFVAGSVALQREVFRQKSAQLPSAPIGPLCTSLCSPAQLQRPRRLFPVPTYLIALADAPWPRMLVIWGTACGIGMSIVLGIAFCAAFYSVRDAERRLYELSRAAPGLRSHPRAGQECGLWC